MSDVQKDEPPNHGKIYTIFCKCGWSTGIGEHGQDVDDFLFFLGAGAKQPCPKCGVKKLFIKNAREAA